jgi:NAD+ kinase
MKLRVKNIIIITKKHDYALVGMTRQVTEWLLNHSVGKKDPYTVYLPSSPFLSLPPIPVRNPSYRPSGIAHSRYVDADFENSTPFDYKGLLSKNPNFKSRVKFWTPDITLRQPHLFDFVITVSSPLP